MAEGAARAAGSAVGEAAARVAAASHEWALRRAELRCAQARLASLRRSGAGRAPAAGPEAPVRIEAESRPATVARARTEPDRAAEDQGAVAASAAGEPAGPGPGPEAARSALSDLALDILTGGSAPPPARTGRPEDPA